AVLIVGRVEEADQSRRVDRCRVHLARQPGPALFAQLDPTAIVERCKAPGGIIDPGLAPRSDIDPLAAAIGRPTFAHLRLPDRAVAVGQHPHAVARGILEARDLRRAVVRSGGVILADALDLGGDAADEIVLDRFATLE